MRATEFLTEETTLNQIYRGGLPDRDELIWEYIGNQDLDKPLEVQMMPTYKLMIQLLSQYHVEHIDELTSQLKGSRKQILKDYMKDPGLSDNIIVICDGRIVDGNHRAVAAALKGVPIHYVDLNDLDQEIDETINRDILNPGFKHQQEIGDFLLKAEKKSGKLVITCFHEGSAVGSADFNINEKNLTSDLTWVSKQHRSMGVASTMYAYAKMLGNDVVPSSQQLPPGKAMWDAWRKSGEDKHLVAEDSYTPPTLHTGDKILKGKFKNSPAEIKGFGKDKHNQPTLRTTKGDIQLFKPRVTKLMDKDLDEDWKHAAAAGAIALGALSPFNNPAPNQLPNAPIVSPVARTPHLAEKILITVAKASGIVGVELAQLLAQCSHETANYSTMQEKGSPTYFARKYDPRFAPKKAKLLGNKKAGDGVKYHGRGFIQLTGRYNYGAAEKALGIPLLAKPELAADPQIAAKIAIWYWNSRVKPHAGDFSDTGKVTHKINAPQRGLADRQAKFADYKGF